MKKLILSHLGAVKSRYETTELFLKERADRNISIIDNSISISKGSKVLIIDNNANIEKEDIIKFSENFENSTTVFERINAIVNPSASSTEFLF